LDGSDKLKLAGVFLDSKRGPNLEPLIPEYSQGGEEMNNPWREYFTRSNTAKFHPADEVHCHAFNEAIAPQKNSHLHKLREDLEPLPYLGNQNAPILVLLANPGAGGSGPERNVEFSGKKLELHKKNLLHDQQDTNDYAQKFNSPDDNLLESPYFKQCTRELVNLTSVEAVATRIFFVNYHAYQSKSWFPIPFTFPTQDYTFFLVDQAVKRNALIIMKRNMLGWFTAVPSLSRHRNIGEFKSSRRISLTERNLEESVFQEVVERLRG